MAGVPRPIITQARKKLSQLEAQNSSESVQDDLFANAQETVSEIDDHLDEPNPIEIAVRELDPDSLSPKEALETLYQLKKLLG